MFVLLGKGEINGYICGRNLKMDKLDIMAKVHITFTGGQILPLYIGWKETGGCDTLVLVHSGQTQEEAERLVEVIAAPAHEMVECSDSDFVQMQRTAEALFEAYAQDEVVLNLTGGLKPWGLLFRREFAKHTNAQMIYVDQNNYVTDIDTLKQRQGEGVDMLTRLGFYSKLSHHRSLSDYAEDDFKCAEELERLRRCNYKDFQRLTSPDKSYLPLAYQGRIELSEQTYIDWNKEEGRVELSVKDNKKGVPVVAHLYAPHAMELAFHYTWFELKVARDVQRMPEVKEVWMNCTFASKDNRAKNEIDIIADLGTKFLFVECKTQPHDTTDLDKFHSAMRNFSGSSTKGAFVILDAPGKQEGHIREKCKDNGLAFYSYRQQHDRLKSGRSYDSLAKVLKEGLNKQNKR